jgi:MFS transporter, Spinster family, sphingosine-1-phosphate transporter
MSAVAASTLKPRHGAVDIVLDSRRSWYVLTLLTLSYALSYIDRQMLNLLVDPIKRSLLVSDTQFSFVQGSAFVLAYLLATPVFGRLVDLTNRRNILIFGVSCWSICTVLCGAAKTYPELFAARFGMGASEACVFPVCWSLIADYFSARRAPRALSILTVAPVMGGGFSLVSSGLVISFARNLRAQIPSLGSLQTWQLAFVVIGVPSFLFAITLLTIREPHRRKILIGDVADRSLTAREVVVSLWMRRHFYARICLAVGMIAVVQLGIAAWFPSFMIRVHSLPAAQTGYKLGVLSVIAGVLGMLMAPLIARWLQVRGRIDAPLRISGFAMIGMLCCCTAFPLLEADAAALCAAAGAVFCTIFSFSLIFAATQIVTPTGMQGVVASLYTFSAQIVGYGTGPTIIALFTDKVFHDSKMVGYSLQIVTCAACTVAAVLLFSALRHYQQMLAEVADIGAVATEPPTPLTRELVPPSLK